MSYKSVLWTAKTPITYDRLAQMQQNIDELKAIIDGNSNTWVDGMPRGAGQGILNSQKITTGATLTGNAIVNIGQAFTPRTEAGRRYLFECYLPWISGNGGAMVLRLLEGTTQLTRSVFAPNNFGYTGIYLQPGYATTKSYHVDLMAFSWDITASGNLNCNAENVGYITFTDVGPAIGNM